MLGRYGESLIVGTGNTERIWDAGRYFIPDILDHAARIIGEVKNVQFLSYTRQLRAFVAWAQARGYVFNLYVRQGTVLSGPLQRAVNAGLINLIRVLP